MEYEIRRLLRRDERQQGRKVGLHYGAGEIDYEKDQLAWNNLERQDIVDGGGGLCSRICGSRRPLRKCE
jgi:hypothetical protein